MGSTGVASKEERREYAIVCGLPPVEQ
ncbi:hypothetical protein A2U01_0067601, partial [Trifolium medium]|nr:hypothetical protein [Trifolium medium]